MITITPIQGGQYRIDSVSGPRSIVVSLAWLNGLLKALQREGMIGQSGQRLVPPRR